MPSENGKNWIETHTHTEKDTDTFAIFAFDGLLLLFALPWLQNDPLSISHIRRAFRLCLPHPHVLFWSLLFLLLLWYPFSMLRSLCVVQWRKYVLIEEWQIMPAAPTTTTITMNVPDHWNAKALLYYIHIVDWITRATCLSSSMSTYERNSRYFYFLFMSMCSVVQNKIPHISSFTLLRLFSSSYCFHGEKKRSPVLWWKSVRLTWNSICAAQKYK